MGSAFIQGTDILLDTVNFYISTSIKINDRLLHLYSDEKGTYLGEIKNNKINPVYKFDFKFHSYLHQFDNQGNQILSFYIPNIKKYGILIINNKSLKFKVINQNSCQQNTKQ